MIPNLRFTSTNDGTYGRRHLVIPERRHSVGVMWITASTPDALRGGTGTNGELQMINALAEAGHPVSMVTQMDGFGNAAAVSAAMLGYNDLIALGCEARVILIGLSKGHANAVQFARQNISKVRGIIGLEPATHLQSLRDRNPLGARALIDTAAGVTYPTALPAGFEIIDWADDLRGSIPWLGFVGVDDTSSLPAETQAFGAAIGGTTHIVAGDHTTAMANVNPAAIVAWVDSLGGTMATPAGLDRALRSGVVQSATELDELVAALRAEMTNEIAAAVKADTNFLTASTTFVDVPGLSVTFTMPDKPIIIRWSFSCRVEEVNQSGFISLFRVGQTDAVADGAVRGVTASWQERVTGELRVPNTNDNPPIGASVTYKFQSKTSAATSDFTVLASNEGAFGRHCASLIVSYA